MLVRLPLDQAPALAHKLTFAGIPTKAKKNTAGRLLGGSCLKRRHVYEASKPHGRTAKINFGFMSTIVYDGGLRPK